MGGISGIMGLSVIELLKIGLGVGDIIFVFYFIIGVFFVVIYVKLMG